MRKINLTELLERRRLDVSITVRSAEMDHTRHVIGNKRNAPAKAKLRMHSGQILDRIKNDRPLTLHQGPVL